MTKQRKFLATFSLKSSIFPTVLLVTLLLLFSGCKKSDDLILEKNEKERMKFATKEQKLKYSEVHLKVIGNEIAKFAKDPAFKKHVHEMANNKFDGEYNVLIRDLFANSEWSQKFNLQKLNKALEAFKDLEDYNYYPQIYIPRLQYIEDKNLIIKEDDGIEDPYFGFNLNDNNLDTTIDMDLLPGYYYDINDSILVRFTNMDEPYANLNEVWIINLNESDGLNGFFHPTLLEPIEPPSGGGGGSQQPIVPELEPYVNGNNLPLTNCKIENMIVKMHKETWFSGGSEIHIKTALTTHNNMPNGRIRTSFFDQAFVEYKGLRTSNSPKGHFIRKFNRKEVCNNTMVAINYPLEDLWPYGDISAPAFCDFVIFEFDGWPAEINELKKFRKEDFRISFNEVATTYNLPYRCEIKMDKRGPDWNSPYINSSIVNTSFLVNQNYPYWNQLATINWAGMAINVKTY